MNVRKRRTRVFALFIILVLSLFILPFTAFAEDTSPAQLQLQTIYCEKPSNPEKYFLKINLIGTPQPGQDVVIPADFINSGTKLPEQNLTAAKTNAIKIVIGEGITGIGNGAFKGLDTTQEPSDTNPAQLQCVTSIELPSTLRNIGDNAFEGLLFLHDIKMPSVQTIGKMAFAAAGSAQTSQVEGEMVEGAKPFNPLIFPEGLTTVGDAAFIASGVKSLTIPKTVTSLSGGAFSKCNKLTDVQLLNGITNIGQLAFSYCSNLSNITIPPSVTTIAEDSFKDVNKQKLTINGATGSAAETYATSKGFTFNAIQFDQGGTTPTPTPTPGTEDKYNLVLTNALVAGTPSEDGKYEPGTKIVIASNGIDASKGESFGGWEVINGDVSFVNATTNQPTTDMSEDPIAFVMPNSDLTINGIVNGRDPVVTDPPTPDDPPVTDPPKQVSTPVIGEAEENSSGVFVSKITCFTEGAKVYYTIDGSEPTEKSNLYVEPIVIDKFMLIRAIAVKEGSENSLMASKEFTTKPTVLMTDGIGRIVNSDQSAIFRASAEVAYLDSIKVDDQALEENVDYVAVDDLGGTKITLTKEFISGFEAGKHNIEINFVTGTVDTMFYIRDLTGDRSDAQMLNGKDLKIVSNDTVASFRSSADMSSFQKVLVNGKIVDSKYYTVKEGSTIITFTPAYVALLGGGEYIVDIVSENEIATTSFTVDKASLPDGPTSKPDDSSSISDNTGTDLSDPGSNPYVSEDTNDELPGDYNTPSYTDVGSVTEETIDEILAENSNTADDNHIELIIYIAIILMALASLTYLIRTRHSY